MKNPRTKFIVLFTVLLIGLAIDLWTKQIAFDQLQDESVSIIDNYFNLTFVENHAIAFSIFSNLDRDIRLPLIFVLTLSATFLAWFMIWKIRDKPFRILLPLFVILGGAYGNIIDRAMNGYVTDFFHAHWQFEHHFPVFNVADVLVNIGLGLIILQWKDFKVLFDDPAEKKAAEAKTGVESTPTEGGKEEIKVETE